MHTTLRGLPYYYQSPVYHSKRIRCFAMLRCCVLKCTPPAVAATAASPRVCWRCCWSIHTYNYIRYTVKWYTFPPHSDAAVDSRPTSHQISQPSLSQATMRNGYLTGVMFTRMRADIHTRKTFLTCLHTIPSCPYRYTHDGGVLCACEMILTLPLLSTAMGRKRTLSAAHCASTAHARASANCCVPLCTRVPWMGADAHTWRTDTQQQRYWEANRKNTYIRYTHTCREGFQIRIASITHTRLSTRTTYMHTVRHRCCRTASENVRQQRRLRARLADPAIWVVR